MGVSTVRLAERFWEKWSVYTFNEKGVAWKPRLQLSGEMGKKIESMLRQCAPLDGVLERRPTPVIDSDV